MHDCKKCEKPNCCGKDGGECCNVPNVKKSVSAGKENNMDKNVMDKDNKRRSEMKDEDIE